MTADDIVSEVCQRAWALGVAVRLSPTQTVSTGASEVGGFFQDDAPTLVCAVEGDPSRWLGTLLHEFNHACQWAEDSVIWRNATESGRVWDWLDGKSVKGIEDKIAGLRELEADCERRTVRLIREMQAPIDLVTYTRAANAYVHFYNTLATTRKWYAPGKGPYDNREVTALCNSTIDRDFSKTPPKLAKALLTCV